jgi:hypothetical protein
MFDPYAQMNPWFSGLYGTAQPFGFASQQPFPMQSGWGLGWQSPVGGLSPFGQGGFAPQIPPQTWFGYPAAQPGALNNPILQQVAQQIPQLVQNAHQIAQQAPQLVQQLPQLIQQNPQLVQQAPQLQQVPQLLQQAAILAQQIPHVLQALCTSPHNQSVSVGGGPFLGSTVGFRPLGYGQTIFA